MLLLVAARVIHNSRSAFTVIQVGMQFSPNRCWGCNRNEFLNERMHAATVSQRTDFTRRPATLTSGKSGKFQFWAPTATLRITTSGTRWRCRSRRCNAQFVATAASPSTKTQYRVEMRLKLRTIMKYESKSAGIWKVHTSPLRSGPSRTTVRWGQSVGGSHFFPVSFFVWGWAQGH